MQHLKALLDKQYALRNSASELSFDTPDPLFIARKHKDSEFFAEIALICALLSYGNARAIVKLLSSLNFTLLTSLHSISALDSAEFAYYRFQTSSDIKALFEIVASLLESGGLKAHFMKVYKARQFKGWDKSQNIYHANVLEGIYACIDALYNIAKKRHIAITNGLKFALGASLSAHLKSHSTIPANAAPLKRWNMLLRWLVRKDKLDVGTWQDGIDTAHLILPLDTHTFHVCLKLGLLKRKSYDLQSALLATDTLSSLNPKDPIAYDFALYRIGQQNIALV